jgi:cAMP phosphodiesterase
MHNLYKVLTFSLILLLSFTCLGQTPSFKVVPLGVKGGIDESNLSAYMVAAYGTNNYICLDAGTLHAGIQKAIAHKTFSIPAEQVLKQYIKAYFISHSHLDHLSGLLINSPDDTTKTIYANADCIEVFKNNYFTWKSWANFASEGEKPQLNKYRYEVLTPGREVNVTGTGLQVQAFPLSHSNLQSVFVQ